MKLLFVIFIVIALQFSVGSGLFSGKCKLRKKLCQTDKECCPVNGRRMVCGPQFAISETKKYCITEVEEQQEKQAAVIRNRKPKSKRSMDVLLDEE